MNKILLTTILLFALVSVILPQSRTNSNMGLDSYCLLEEVAENADKEYSQTDIEEAICFSPLYNEQTESSIFSFSQPFHIIRTIADEIFEPPRQVYTKF